MIFRGAVAARPGLLRALALGLVVRAVPFVLALPDPERFFTLDGRQYIELARDLRAGYLDPGSALWSTGLVRTPGYPLFAAVMLWLGRDSVVAVILAQIALSLIAILLAYLLAAKWFGQRAASLCALVLALDPATSIYTNLLQPESLFTLLVLLSVLSWFWALDSGALCAAGFAGLFAGLATLTRPIGLFLPIPLLVMTATTGQTPRRRLALTLVVLLTFCIPVGGWVVRNDAYTGVPLLSTIEGVNLLNYRAAGALAIEEGRDIEEERLILARELERRGPKPNNPALESRAQSALAAQVLLEHPYGALRSALSGVTRLALGTGLTALSGLRGDVEPERIDGGMERSLQVLLAGLLSLSYLGAFVGTWSLLRQREYEPLIILSVFVLYFGLISAGPEATTRFRVPLMPFVAVLAGVGFSRLQKDVK